MENFKITAKLFYLIKNFKNRNDISDYFKTILQQKYKVMFETISGPDEYVNISGLVQNLSSYQDILILYKLLLV